jgi:hypothetical protein
MDVQYEIIESSGHGKCHLRFWRTPESQPAVPERCLKFAYRGYSTHRDASKAVYLLICEKEQPTKLIVALFLSYSCGEWNGKPGNMEKALCFRLGVIIVLNRIMWQQVAASCHIQLEEQRFILYQNNKFILATFTNNLCLHHPNHNPQ